MQINQNPYKSIRCKKTPDATLITLMLLSNQQQENPKKDPHRITQYK